MSESAAEEREQDALKPWGKVLTGQPGISAARIAHALGVPVGVVKRLARPSGSMKMPYFNAFGTYDPAIVEELREHPEVKAAQARRAARDPGAARRAAETRRERVAEHLCRARPDLEPLYRALVEALWSPATERRLLEYSLFTRFTATLWDALQPRPEAQGDATTIVVDILWAVLKQHTWKVNEDGGQDTPLALQLWDSGVSAHSFADKWENVFAAAVRHLWYNDGPKWEGREKALARLREISTRQW